MIDTLAVIVMSKFPTPGRVKTRLQPELTPEQAAGVHRALLVHTLRRIAGRQPGKLVVAFDPAESEAAFRDLLVASGVRDGELLAQGDGDLGQRIARIHALLAPSHPRQLFLGVDSPDLPADHLSHAARLAYQAQVTLGPTADGGYWCLGLDRSVDALSLLTGIDWSSGLEAQETIDRAGALGYSVAMADAWDDVDRAEDLRRLLQRLGESRSPSDRELLNAIETAMRG